MAIEAPAPIGSMDQFAEQSGLKPDSAEAFRLYTEALATYRQGIAAHAGVTIEQLHMGTTIPPEASVTA